MGYTEPICSAEIQESAAAVAELGGAQYAGGYVHADWYERQKAALGEAEARIAARITEHLEAGGIVFETCLQGHNWPNENWSKDPARIGPHLARRCIGFGGVLRLHKS